VTKGGKVFLGPVFLLAAVGCVVGFVVANKNYDDATFSYGVNKSFNELSSSGPSTYDRPRPEAPKPLLYFGAAGAFLLASFVAFNSAAATRNQPGRHAGTSDEPTAEEPL
jgi:hypothetical protein